MIKIILAEDHVVVRNGLKALLSKQYNLNVVAEATNAAEVLNLIEAAGTPDILVTDINMPGKSGFELAEHVKAQYPSIKVLFLSMLDNEKHVGKAFRSGASGYLLKNVTAEELIFAIQHIHGGGKYMCAELTVRSIDRLINLPTTDDSLGEVANTFSQREVEALELIAQGLTNEDIANKLFTSKRTVEGYRKSMLQKANLVNTASLIYYAVRNKIIN